MNDGLKLRKAIDSTNEKLWKKRFDSISSVENACLDSLSKAEMAGYPEGTAYASLNLAAIYFLNSRTEDALEKLKVALSLFKERKQDKGYARAILLRGNIYESYGDYEKTLSLWLEALKVSRENGDNESEAEACNQLGLVYFRLSDYKKSVDYLEKALKMREELNDINGLASTLNRTGMVLRQTKKYSESLEYYFRSLEIRKRNRQKSAIPWTLLGIATTYEDSGEYEKARQYYKEGMNNSDTRCLLQCMMGVGRLYSRDRDFELAEELLSKALKMAKSLRTLYLIADAYASLAAHFEMKGEAFQALENYKLFRETRESLLSEESQSRLRTIEISHAVEKSEQEKEIFRLRNVELRKAYDIIEEKNRDITSSISYAGRIQTALLPRVSEIKGLSPHIFILYLPKDIISGDFYWFTESDGSLILAAGDCTGHGVPGALMSMLGISFLEEIVNKQGIKRPGKILDHLSLEIRKALRQKGDFTDSKDGMAVVTITLLPHFFTGRHFGGDRRRADVVHLVQGVHAHPDQHQHEDCGPGNEDHAQGFFAHRVTLHGPLSPVTGFIFPPSFPSA
jgi:tetratricopeptide (TPR) repeat protein